MYTFENNVVNNLTPSEFYLSQNYPNPFDEKTTIKFCVAYKTKVKLEVLDIESKIIKILIDEEKEAGTYEVEFSAKGGSVSCGDTTIRHSRKGGNLLIGIYVYELQAGDYKSKKQMIISI